MTLPPSPVYPIAIDSDRTLYLVYNTSESRTTADNPPWSDEISIEPSDLWADNGFANISGELFYYDKVLKNVDGKVYRLLRCARNLDGKQTQFNYACTWVRGFVVAEHHNQLADTIINIENFIGIDNSIDTETLDYRIRCLLNQPDCIDDFDCPSINFHFNVSGDGECSTSTTLSNNPCSGRTATFNVEINGQFTNYRLDFGDGNFTFDTTGTHVYATNATIDPVITVGNSKCQIIQTPTSRDDPETPQEQVPITTFTVPIPPAPDFPGITIPSNVIPSQTLTLPPFLQQCDFGSIGPIDIPSVISFVPSNPVPSIISITPVNIPSVINFGPVPVFPNVNFGPVPLFPDIGFETPPTFPPIEFGPIPSFPSIEVVASITMPSTISIMVEGFPSTIAISCCSSISVDWGTPPVVSCVVSVVCPPSSGGFAMRQVITDDFIDGFENNDIQVESMDIGIPDEIKIVAPKLPDIKIVHDLPVEIKLNVPHIPDMNLVVPDNFPREIRIVNDTFIPEKIFIDATKIPSSISLESNLPTHIKVVAVDIPSSIYLDGTGIPSAIQVKGIPSFIELIGNIPSEITVKVPENLHIPLVYEGGPIPFRFDSQESTTDDDQPCFHITPCPKR